MQKLVTILGGLLLSLMTFGQPHGNEWIEYNQTYLKFYVVDAGVHKISYSDLDNLSSIDIDTINPNTIQVWGRGQQQYIHIEGSTDNSFDINDFIEFYAEPNDGWFDTLLYGSINNQANPYFSLYNDTATYFITFHNNIADNYRFNNVTATSISTPDDYFLETIVDYDPTEYWQGEYTPGQGKKNDVDYTSGEGWFYPYYSGTSSRLISLSTPNIYTGLSSPDAAINTKYAGVNNPSDGFPHHVEINVNGSGTPVHSNVFNSFGMFNVDFTIPTNQLTNTTTLLYQNGSSASALAKTAVAYANIMYPRTYNSINASAYLFRIPSNTSTHQIELSSFSNPFGKAFVYDFENNTRTTINTSSVEFTLPAGNERNIYVFSNENINYKTPIQLKSVTTNGRFRDYLANDSQHSFLIVSAKAFMDESREYASYRASTNGGGHDTIVANIDQLYDQFSYGIHKHPLSIRHFADYLLDNLSTPPANLFLIGKSVVYRSSRSGAAFEQNLVPTMGNPATDNVFTAGLNGTIFESAIPTGRLAALNGNQVLIYLDKVRELESFQNDTINYSIADKEWMKHALHIGGGDDLGQQLLFKGYLQAKQNVLEDTLFGGNVHEYYKSSSSTIAPINQNDYLEIKGWIEDGLSIITFFGHSSATGFDVGIDQPEAYNNQGKYPLFNAFGCQSGDIHSYISDPSTSTTTSEKSILTANHGAIGFFASTDAGLASEMNLYSNYYYQNISYNHYGESIGEIIKATVIDFQNPSQNTGINTNKATCMELSLHGDPSIKLNPHSKPDYAIEASSVSFSPSVVSTSQSTFTLNVDITNLGRAVDDTVSIFVERFVEGNSVSITQELIPPIHYNHIYQLTLPTDPGSGSGTNTFDIWVNKYPVVGTQPEILTSNNYLLSNNAPSLYISSSDLIPIFPYNYAVVGHEDIILKASTADVFAPTLSYTIQIDTTDTYLSPIADTVIIQSGGVVSWQPNITNLLTDSVVFFWRCTPTDDLTKWREHSFQYIQDETGWGQDDFFQFKNDEFWVVNHDRPSEKFRFDSLTKQINCQTVGSANSIIEYNNTYYWLDGVTIKNGICNAAPAMYVAVFDSLTLEPWEEYYVDASGNPVHADRQFGNTFDNLNCWNGQSSPSRVFIFPTNNAQSIDHFTNMITDSVGVNNYILVYTARTGNFSDNTIWDTNNLDALESLGCTELSTNGVLNPNVSNDSPYIFFFKQGDVSSLQEVIGNPSETIQLNPLMRSSLSQGYIESTRIGPAYNWGTVSWQHTADEVTGQDSVNLEIYVEGFNGQDSLVVSYLNQPNGSINNFNSVVDAAQFPYLKLRTYIYDNTLKTSGQLERWHVLYGGIPEAALDPHTFFSFPNDTIQEGQPLEVSIAIENVSVYDMDSLRVSYSIERNGASIPITYPLQDSLRALDFLIDTISYKTLGVKKGINTLFIEVNPEDSLWQLEQYHFNNIARQTFYVQPDITNPMLDVTFDGIHILDGDIVSPEPNIVIELKDENPYIAIDDTSNFNLYLIDPDENQTLLRFDGSDPILFTPANLPENKAKVEYTPTLTTDGIYTLRVQGNDASGNIAGDYDYSISFEVINKSTITDIMNYPNPFSTSTRFVFVLTGSKIPDQFKIQILSVSGKVVREITKDELGPLHIGRNITQYAWDGTDEFGDPLANGVYLYRVVTKIGGQTIEHRSTEADSYFHKGFGKMYLMR